MRLIQNSFIGGEISPELFGRHDLEAYFHAAKTLRNFNVRKTGGLRKRQGTQLVAMVHASYTDCRFRLFPYFYDRTRYGFIAMYLKGGNPDLYYRLYRSDGEALSEEAAVPQAVASAPSTGYFDALRCRQIGDTLFFSSREKAAFKGYVDYAAVTVSWEKMAGAIPVAAAPALAATARNFGTSGDGYVASARRYGLIGVKDNVYSKVREKTASITLPWKAGAQVQLSFTADWSSHDYYLLCAMQGGSWTVLSSFYPDPEQDPPPTAMSMVDDNIVAGDVAGVMEQLKVGDADMDVDVVDVWEQRLVMAGSGNKPFTMWFSRRGDVGNFYATRPQTGDDAFELTLAVTTASRILHTVTGRWFVMFTESGEYSVDSADKSGFAYNTAICKKTSSVGAHEGVEPAMTESQILFVASDGKTVYELSYNLEQDNIMPQNRSILASHMTEGAKIRKIAYMRFPEPRLLCLLDDGDVLEMTYAPAQKICAWSRTSFSGGMKCVDIAVPGSIREEDGLESSSEVLLMFEQPGVTDKVWVERYRAPSVGDVQDPGKSMCADHCGYEEADYPAGEDPRANVEALAVTVRPELQEFNSMGQCKNVYDCVLRLNRSGCVRIRPDTGRLADATSALQATASPAVDPGTGAVSLFTGDVRLLPFAYQNTDGRMAISSDDGWPCEILSVLFNIEVADYGPKE